MIGIVIKPDKTVEERTLTDYKDIQTAIGGYFDVVTLSDGTSMFVDDEYLIKGGLDFNSIATDVCGLGGRPDIMFTNPILGPVVVLGPPDSSGETTDITDKARNWIKRVAREA